LISKGSVTSLGRDDPLDEGGRDLDVAYWSRQKRKMEKEEFSSDHALYLDAIAFD
jgi:hypothetical protein